MNRILKRPMFRIGGSAGTGITTGLDTPRKNYFDAGRVLPTQEEFTKAQEMFPQFQRPQGEGLSRFLTTFGLDLLSRPPEGGFLSTVASAAKGPTEQLFKDIDTERATKFATDADLFKTLIEAKAEAAGGTSGKTYAKLEIANDIERTMDKIFDIKKRIAAGETGLENDLDKAEKRLTYLSRENTVGKSLMNQTDFASDVLKTIIKSLKAEEVPDPNNPDQMILKYPDGDDDPLLLREAFRQYAEFFSKVPEAEAVEEAKASGGRVGRAMGTPMTGERPADQETREEPKIDFATLRARLPKEIGDDIVKLIALSPEALEDFATIATQQDVDLFNQKYSVNLVLPQE